MTFWTDYVPSDRDILITKVQHGELTPHEAEREATRLGLGPFTHTPNPSDFDPLREATWSLPMMLACVEYGTTDAVREMWDPYREKFRYWFFQRWQVPGSPSFDGHFIKTKDHASLYEIATLDMSTPRIPGIESYLDAFRSLSNAAQSADWRASGVPTDSIRRREILPFEWADFDVCETKDAGGIKRAVLRMRRALDNGYNEVLFPVKARFSFPANTGQQCLPAANVRARHRGRSPGSGGYAQIDEPHLEQMHYLMLSGEAVSAEEAARMVADHARGASFGAKVDRLAKRFRRKYGSNFTRKKSD
jgi:hypothetical protein